MCAGDCLSNLRQAIELASVIFEGTVTDEDMVSSTAPLADELGAGLERHRRCCPLPFLQPVNRAFKFAADRGHKPAVDTLLEFPGDGPAHQVRADVGRRLAPHVAPALAKSWRRHRRQLHDLLFELAHGQEADSLAGASGTVVAEGVGTAVFVMQ